MGPDGRRRKVGGSEAQATLTGGLLSADTGWGSEVVDGAFAVQWRARVV